MLGSRCGLAAAGCPVGRAARKASGTLEGGWRGHVVVISCCLCYQPLPGRPSRRWAGCPHPAPQGQALLALGPTAAQPLEPAGLVCLCWVRGSWGCGLSACALWRWLPVGTEGSGTPLCLGGEPSEGPGERVERGTGPRVPLTEQRCTWIKYIFILMVLCVRVCIGTVAC